MDDSPAITLTPVPPSCGQSVEQYRQLCDLVDHYQKQGLDATIDGTTVVVTMKPGDTATAPPGVAAGGVRETFVVKDAAPFAYTRMGTILGQRKGRPRPKTLEPVLTRGVRSGRNDPCQCGSGRKRKRCHP